ncbi:MAG TPA: 3TM-type holin [Verrucomicrobiota bacterium]|nr:3TM-type holin [Verrucomicrobiota bacterium]
MDLTGLGAVADLAGNVINRIWPDASEAEKAKLTVALAQLNAELETAKGQAAVNAVEAGNASVFVSGWRPAIGWLCAVALGYQYVVYPLLLWLTVFWPHVIAPHPVTSDVLMELLFGMLGLAGLRSYEKVRGAAGRAARTSHSTRP